MWQMGTSESRIVDTNPVVEALGRRLRLAVIGGGPGSFIGEMHRAASRLDDRYRIVAAALSSDAERGRAAARRIGGSACRRAGRACVRLRDGTDRTRSRPSRRSSGAAGTVEWHQDRANELRFLPLDGPAQVRTRNGPGTLPLSARGSRVGKGHPEGFHEGFANIYADVAEAVAARRSGRAPDPLALHFPTAADGARGLAFVEAALASSAGGGGWVDCGLTLD